MLWHAMPPELNTAMLMAGPGAAPMLATAAAYSALSKSLETQAEELSALLVSLKSAWTGASSERAIAATSSMVAWLQTAAKHSELRGLQASAQAASYMKALGMTPSLPEIEANHITHAILNATNFLGINLVPIGLNETDYFVRMWTQAGTAMDVYHAETLANTTFQPLPPVKPILQSSTATASVPASRKDDPEVDPEEDELRPIQVIAKISRNGGPMQQMLDEFEQAPSELQSLFSQASNAGQSTLSGLGESAHSGLAGTSALSSHPLAGGSGASAGKGLGHGRGLPGSGGSSPRTPLLAQMIEKHSGGIAPAAAAPVAPSAARAGAAMGGAGMGGTAPMAGMMGAGGRPGGGGGRESISAPTPTVLAPAPDDEGYFGGDDFDVADGDDW